MFGIARVGKVLNRKCAGRHLPSFFCHADSAFTGPDFEGLGGFGV